MFPQGKGHFMPAGVEMFGHSQQHRKPAAEAGQGGEKDDSVQVGPPKNTSLTSIKSITGLLL